MACQTLTVKGALELRLKRDAKTLSMLVRSSPGMVGTVGLPKNPQAPFTKVTVNGVVVWAKTGETRKLAGLESAGEDGQYLKFTIQAGEWNFTAE